MMAEKKSDMWISTYDHKTPKFGCSIIMYNDFWKSVSILEIYIISESIYERYRFGSKSQF